MPNFIPSVESVLRRALNLFKAEFESCPEIAACGPGRVNLIGEHTDYNEGFVLPMALPLVTIVAGKANGTNEVRLHTATDDVDHPHKIKFLVNEEIQAGKPKWANYMKGVIAKFNETVPGFDAVIVSSVPAGGGVSSSAALEVATYTFLEALVGKQTASFIEKAQVCQVAENIYAGVPCGIMDQLVSVYGRENHVLLIDCRTLEVVYVPLDDPEIVILITNSNVKHELTGGEYAIRRKQCEEAAKHLGKKSLRDAVQSDLLGDSSRLTSTAETVDETLQLSHQVTGCYDSDLEKKGVNKTVIARARHVITENKRTVEGAKALEQRNYTQFGKLMVQSHNSLRDDFEVSCKELDEIVEAAVGVDGVYGCRMTGGGFGGCTVALLKKDAVNECINSIKLRYSGDPVFYICKPSGGTRPLTVVPN